MKYQWVVPALLALAALGAEVACVAGGEWLWVPVFAAQFAINVLMAVEDYKRYGH